ncbi:hypothetical protein EGW08_011777 [Elysia chlorotica]|uniref:G-protein coupled receptors family 1 profile domain-containing protein n=1 Tax=Elysia chlorotica TaxID=188477 RepID=A0A3S0ZLE8_ELYCH|nr:hypothetical protein EGW08_011777 [Elysia chlorotica]
MMVILTTLPNATEKDLSLIEPIISAELTRIIGYINTFVLAISLGALGIFANTANISVYLKMGLQETTNINFFALSAFDLFVSLGAVVIHLTYNRPLSVMRLPSGALVGEIGIGSCFVFYPCLGCSAWITAILSVERCLCISMPLKIKQIATPKRMVLLILTMAAYELIFIVLLYIDPGPPYQVVNPRASLYFICSFSAPCLVCFFIVLISTVLLVVRLKQNLEWRNELNEAPKQTIQISKGSKEMKAARSVVAICVIFIVCFAPNVALFALSLVDPRFTPYDPYYGNLMRPVYALSSLLQVFSSAVNIVVYYKMSTKYREVFRAIFCRKD